MPEKICAHIRAIATVSDVQLGVLPSVAIFTLLAIVELVADKLPQTLSRTAPAHKEFFLADCFAIGGVVGCFAGYEARTRLVQALGMRDIYIALGEDLVAIAGSLWWFRGSSQAAEVADAGPRCRKSMRLCADDR